MKTDTNINNVNTENQRKSWNTPIVYCLDIDKSEKIPFFTETIASLGAGS